VRDTFPGVRLRFSKYEGLGNDFVVVDAERDDALTAADAERLCDRRRGIGADGVLLLLPAKDASAVARMRVLNADGSTPEMCGNGLRCVALHLARERGAKALEAVVETDAGPRFCSVNVGDAGEADVLVDMGEVRTTGHSKIVVEGQSFDLHLATAGNPHAIWFCDQPLENAQRFGLALATHPSFAEGTNVGFAHVVSGAEGSGIDLVVWERGVGLTLACGTGACAVAVVAREHGLVPPGPVRVRLPGGSLEIDPDPKGRTRMRGPARLVYEGILA
jgi:diaminopimelate epimerase